MFFKQIAKYLCPRMRKLVLIQDIIILNLYCMDLNEGTRKDDFFIIKLAALTVTLALECANSNLIEMLSY